MKLRRTLRESQTYADLEPGMLFVFVAQLDCMKGKKDCVCEKLDGNGGFVVHDGTGHCCVLLTNHHVTILTSEDVEIVPPTMDLP